MIPLHFVVCTRGPADSAQTVRSLRAHGLQDHVTVFDHNQAGLSECYNKVITQHQGREEILVLMHDDIAIWDILLAAKLDHAVSKLGYDIVGLAGSKSFTPRPNRFGIVGWDSGDNSPRAGAVEHELKNGQALMIVFGPTPAECAVIDGLFMAIDMRKIGTTRFDERFAFHFYDLDFCVSARANGLRIGVTNIHVMHMSLGGFDSPAFKAAQEVFLAKHAT